MNQKQKTVVLVGKLGHGKTRILNKTCGKNFPSNAGAVSCTQTLQHSYTRRHNIFMIDTPGMCASDDIAAHIAGQKVALEGVELSGVYAVVKWGRADDIAELLDSIMNFLGDEDIRVIITHADIARQQDGFHEVATKERLSGLFNIPIRNLMVVGLDTQAELIEDFIEMTLHSPRKLKISAEQIAAITSRSVGIRRVNKSINSVVGKILAATKACQELSKLKGKCYEADVAILATQDTTTKMVEKAKEDIFQDAYETLDCNQQNLVYGKAGVALSLKLQAFTETTNSYLSWDVSDISDSRNHYRKCPHCGAVFNKVEGCDGKTICGAVPSYKKTPNVPRVVAKFSKSTTPNCKDSGWSVEYCVNGAKVALENLFQTISTLVRLKSNINPPRRGLGIFFGPDKKNKDKSEDSKFESGCGATVCWSSMEPIEPEIIQQLGRVELLRPGSHEKNSQISFNSNLEKHEDTNKKILRKMP